MSGIKQESRKRRHRKRIKQHKRSMLAIGAVILLLLLVVSVNSRTLRAKDRVYEAQEAELEIQIKEEEARAEEIAGLENYVGTDEYIEDMAKSRLGLVHENEIIFKAE